MILHWAQNLSTSVASHYKFEGFCFFRFTLLLRSVYRDTLVSVYRYVSWPPNIGAPRCTGEPRRPYRLVTNKFFRFCWKYFGMKATDDSTDALISCVCLHLCLCEKETDWLILTNRIAWLAWPPIQSYQQHVWLPPKTVRLKPWLAAIP